MLLYLFAQFVTIQGVTFLAVTKVLSIRLDDTILGRYYFIDRFRKLSRATFMDTIPKRLDTASFQATKNETNYPIQDFWWRRRVGPNRVNLTIFQGDCKVLIDIHIHGATKVIQDRNSGWLDGVV
jgi:hypothetical protein